MEQQFKELLNGFPRRLIVCTADDRVRGIFMRTTKITHGTPVYEFSRNPSYKIYRTTLSNPDPGKALGFFWVISRKGAGSEYLLYCSKKSNLLAPNQTEYESMYGNKFPPTILTYPKHFEIKNAGSPVNGIYMKSDSTEEYPCYQHIDNDNYVIDTDDNGIWWIYRMNPGQGNSCFYRSEDCSMSFFNEEWILAKKGEFPLPIINAFNYAHHDG
eukprot:Pgem_evm1s10825